MRRAREGLTLALEARQVVVAGGPQHLDRHLASSLAIPGAVHHAHAALAEHLAQLEARVDHVPAAGLGDEGAEPRERAVVEHRHGSTPSTARASLRHSSSVAVMSRKASSTRRRNSRRVQAR